jgi:glucosamine-6-phosphate deaminase
VDRLRVEVHPDRDAMGRAAGAAAATAIAERLRAGPGEVRVVFASAPSQDEMLAALAAAPHLDWARVTAFHMDEYLGLDRDHPAAFGAYLRRHLFDAVRPGRVHYLDGAAPPAGECRRYAALLAEAPIDVCCMGVGENGHLAFNDPPDADFDDPEPVKVVTIDETSRAQQVHDGCFPRLEVVPRTAITLTLPTLLGARRVVCTVPGPTKRDAMRRALRGPIDASCPASGLRRHPSATAYLDTGSWPGGT